MHQFDGARLRRWLPRKLRVNTLTFRKRIEENYQLFSSIHGYNSQSPESSSDFPSPEGQRDQRRDELRKAAYILAADEFGRLKYA